MIWRLLGQFFKDDRAQATTEYIMLISMVVGFFIIFYKGLLKPMIQKLQARISAYLSNLLIKGDLHTFPITNH